MKNYTQEYLNQKEKLDKEREEHKKDMDADDQPDDDIKMKNPA